VPGPRPPSAVLNHRQSGCNIGLHLRPVSLCWPDIVVSPCLLVVVEIAAVRGVIICFDGFWLFVATSCQHVFATFSISGVLVPAHTSAAILRRLICSVLYVTIFISFAGQKFRTSSAMTVLRRTVIPGIEAGQLHVFFASQSQICSHPAVSISKRESPGVVYELDLCFMHAQATVAYPLHASLLLPFRSTPTRKITQHSSKRGVCLW
jgi:hypothetical protein